MRIGTALLAALAALSPAAALACPYANSASTAATCCGGSSSVLGYGAALLLGLGLGIASVAFERRRG